MTFTKKHRLDRRTLLRGTVGGGAFAIGLPLLEAMLNGNGDALAQGAPLPRRFVSWFFGNGVNLDLFEPDAPGSASWTPSFLLQDIADVKDYLTICTGLQNQSQDFMTHHEGLCAFSGYTFLRRPDLPGFASDFGGPTIDQVISDRIVASGVTLPINSLQFQITKFGSPVDTGTTAQVLSARGTPGKLVALPGVANPRRMWEYIFGAPPGPAGVRSSMLDYVKWDLGQVRKRLGTLDQARMETHLEGIRALERKLGGLGSCTAPTQPTEENRQVNGEEHITLVNQLMAQLLAVAFSCDITRVGSVMFLPVAGEATLGDVPATSGKTHHVWSHTQTTLDNDGNKGYETNIRFIMNRYGDWLRAMKAITEPAGGTLLDSCIFYASSDCANGNHTVGRQPIILGGHGRNHLKFPGIHFQAVAGTPGSLNSGFPSAGNMSDVLLTCLHAFDPSATSIGDTANPPGSTTPQLEIQQ
jgi:hypothetical protein